MKSLLGALVALTVGMAWFGPAQSAPITREFTGTIAAVGGSGADVGDGSVTGTATFDDAVDLDPSADQLFELDSFSLTFGGVLTVTEADDPFATIALTPRGSLIGVDLFVLELTGFGIAGPIDLIGDGFQPTGSFVEAFTGEIVAEVTLGLVPTDDTPIPLPGSLALIVPGLALIAAIRKPRKASA